jgi:hypothetical protein
MRDRRRHHLVVPSRLGRESNGRYGLARCAPSDIAAERGRRGRWSRRRVRLVTSTRHGRRRGTESLPVAGSQRAAVLRSAESLDETTTIAVDAVARWLDEPDGEEYAYALLGAVTDEQSQLRAYAQLLGGDA